MTQTYTISILVDNEAGVLARIVALFSSCQYNIDTLNVSAINSDKSLSKITLTTQTNEKQINQIKKQIEKVVPVQSVKHIEIDKASHCELALIKVASHHKEILSHEKKAQVIKETADYCIFEITGVSSFLDQLTQQIPVMDIARTGVLALD